jgi:pentatricopeptide repeat protein
MKMLHEMLDKGHNPNIITFTSIIDGLCKEGKLQEALWLLDVMVQIGHQPNEITYNTLINEFCKVGNLGEGQGAPSRDV